MFHGTITVACTNNSPSASPELWLHSLRSMSGDQRGSMQWTKEIALDNHLLAIANYKTLSRGWSRLGFDSHRLQTVVNCCSRLFQMLFVSVEEKNVSNTDSYRLILVAITLTYLPSTISVHQNCKNTVFSRLNAPGVYFKLGPVKPAFIWSRRLIGARRVLTRCFFCHSIKLIYYHPTSEAQAKLIKTGRSFPFIQSDKLSLGLQ